MITKVYTESVVYTIQEGENTVNDNRLSINNCKITSTSYGSVLVDVPTRDFIIELYPSSISHVIHSKE